MKTNFVGCSCNGQEYIDCECTKCECDNDTCKCEVTLEEFEDQFGREIGYIFDPT